MEAQRRFTAQGFLEIWHCVRILLNAEGMMYQIVGFLCSISSTTAIQEKNLVI